MRKFIQEECIPAAKLFEEAYVPSQKLHEDLQVCLTRGIKYSSFAGLPPRNLTYACRQSLSALRFS